ncbi:MAG: PAS domain S-box protein [Anaerolineales bacterium]
MKNITLNSTLSGSSIRQLFYHAPSDTYPINRILEETPAVSPWVIFVLSITAGIIILFVIYTVLLRNRIETRSRALEESEKRFRRYFMTSKDPVFITSKEGEWLDVNLATVRLFGFENKEDLLASPVQGAYKKPEDRSNLLREVDQRGFVKDFQVDLVDRHGKVLHTILTTTVIKNNKGAVIGYQGTIRDQSEWLSTQKKIQESQDSLDLALTGTGAGYWDWNLKTNRININDRWADMIGYEKSELTPLTVDTWEKLSHPEDLEQFNRLILKHFAGDLYHYQSEIRMKHKNGNWVWILNQGRVVEREPDRSPLRMVGTTQDITERVQAREEIQKFAEQLEALHVITKSLSSTLSLKELLQLILVKLEETLAFDSASIFLYENEELRIETVHNHPNPELVLGKTFSTSNLLFQEIQRHRNPIIIDNAMKDARFQGWGRMHHVKGWMGIPLVIQDTLIGYITLDSKKSSAFGSYEAKIANLFASQAAQAIHNARLYERVTQYAETLETSIEERTQELSKMVDHMAGRELRMAELKDVIDRLRDQLINNDLDPEAQDPLKERTSNI